MPDMNTVRDHLRPEESGKAPLIHYELIPYYFY